MRNTASSIYCRPRVRCNALFNLLNLQQDSRGHLPLNQAILYHQLQPILKLHVSFFSPMSIVFLYYLQTLTESALLEKVRSRITISYVLRRDIIDVQGRRSHLEGGLFHGWTWFNFWKWLIFDFFRLKLRNFGFAFESNVLERHLLVNFTVQYHFLVALLL